MTVVRQDDMYRYLQFKAYNHYTITVMSEHLGNDYTNAKFHLQRITFSEHSVTVYHITETPDNLLS